MQELWPPELWKKPFAQALQPVAIEAEYWPAEHDPVTAERPTTAQYEPAGHDEHEPDPESRWK